ncbi:MAG TPA: YciI family protein [Erysipelotrichaceae bacterium]|nr:YciI family protein [Erysipelotrichaceae bacterium]
MDYLYLMHNIKQLNQTVILDHVEFLKWLKLENRLILCGPFSDYPGGIVVFHALDKDEAKNIVEKDPYIKYGYKSYELHTIELANEENNYLI